MNGGDIFSPKFKKEGSMKGLITIVILGIILFVATGCDSPRGIYEVKLRNARATIFVGDSTYININNQNQLCFTQVDGTTQAIELEIGETLTITRLSSSEGSFVKPEKEGNK